MESSRNRIVRIMRILTALQAGRDFLVDDLAKLLGVSRRTVFRDLEQLRLLGVPYRYNAKTRLYTVDSEYFLPPINLSLQEALCLLFLVHEAGFQMQLPFKKSAVLASLKIESLLPGKIKKYCSDFLENISARVGPQAPMNLLDKVFAELGQAILDKRRVSLEYNSLYERKIIRLELCPYHLMFRERAWYVVGLSGMHNAQRTFKINRIKKLETLRTRFEPPRDFDIQEYLGRAWSLIPEGRLYNIKLRFLPKVAENVTEIHWHSTQKVSREEDGSAIMEFRVDGLGEIFWWILGYGDQVEVLTPKALRERVSKTAHNMADTNKSS